MTRGGATARVEGLLIESDNNLGREGDHGGRAGSDPAYRTDREWTTRWTGMKQTDADASTRACDQRHLHRRNQYQRIHTAQR